MRSTSHRQHTDSSLTSCGSRCEHVLARRSGKAGGAVVAVSPQTTPTCAVSRRTWFVCWMHLGSARERANLSRPESELSSCSNVLRNSKAPCKRVWRMDALRSARKPAESTWRSVKPVQGGTVGFACKVSAAHKREAAHLQRGLLRWPCWKRLAFRTVALRAALRAAKELRD